MKNKTINCYKKYKEIINYLIIGGLTTLVSLLSFYLVRIFIFTSNTQLDIQISNIISWICAVLFAFGTNKKYVFESKSKGTEHFKEMLKFFLSRVTTLLIDMSFMWLFTSPLKINDKASKIIVQFIIVVLNYVFSKVFVFNKNQKV